MSTDLNSILSRFNVILREPIMRLYNADIQEAESNFSSRNGAYVFHDKDFIIRVSFGAKTQRDLQAEFEFIEDVKLYAATVCDPMLSLSGKSVEKETINGKEYSFMKFRKALGKDKEARHSSQMQHLCVGELLGNIHKASRTQVENAIRFPRSRWNKEYIWQKEYYSKCLSQDEIEILEYLLNDIESIPKTSDTYGIVHGDYDLQNMLIDVNNVWLFDFDDCCYHYYLYDIAIYTYTVAYTIFFTSNEKRPAKEIFTEILKNFLIGYRFNKDISDEQLNKIFLFIKLRYYFSIIFLRNLPKEYLYDKAIRALKLYESFIKTNNNDELFFLWEESKIELGL